MEIVFVADCIPSNLGYDCINWFCLTLEDDMEQLQDLLPLLVPLLVIQLILMIAALVDLARRETTRGPKWVWALVILFVNLVGPVVYFLVGRRDE